MKKVMGFLSKLSSRERQAERREEERLREKMRGIAVFMEGLARGFNQRVFNAFVRYRTILVEERAEAERIAAEQAEARRLEAIRVREEVEDDVRNGVAPHHHNYHIGNMSELPGSLGSTKRLRLSGYHSWSLEMWVNVDEVNDRGEHGILSAVSTAVEPYKHKKQGDSLSCVLRAGAEGMLRPQFEAYDVLNGTDSVPVGTWTHLAFVYCADTSEQRILVNGSLNSSKSDCRPLAGNMELDVGHNRPRALLNGSLAEVRLWSCALNEEEIQASMSVPLHGQEEAFQGKLTGLWKFSGTTWWNMLE